MGSVSFLFQLEAKRWEEARYLGVGVGGKSLMMSRSTLAMALSPMGPYSLDS